MGAAVWRQSRAYEICERLTGTAGYGGVLIVMLRVFLSGDVMTGRGIDQVLPFPGDPKLHEPYMKDARDYVALTEHAHGPIVRPISFNYIWGDALAELDRADVDIRIINLETSITTSAQAWPKKAVHYKMHPRNVGCLNAARISACALANNHVLDWHHLGLLETLDTLDAATIPHAGAGRNLSEAETPATIACNETRILLFSIGSVTSGIPPQWSATANKPGIFLIDDLSRATAKAIAADIRTYQKPGDVIIASIHWGGNWGYDVPPTQIDFAHTLIDEGVAVVHGHSSHHIKTLEIYDDRLILYGCGDLITDYEGITGYEMFRGDLAFLYLLEVADDGRLESLRLVPMQMRRFQLHRASSEDSKYLHSLMADLCAGLAPEFEIAHDNSLTLTLRSAHRHRRVVGVQR